jgi:hypothetical protein
VPAATLWGRSRTPQAAIVMLSVVVPATQDGHSRVLAVVIYPAER